MNCIFPETVGNFIIPIDELIFFQGGRYYVDAVGQLSIAADGLPRLRGASTPSLKTSQHDDVS